MKRIAILVCTVALFLPLFVAGCDRGAEEKAKLEKAEKELAELKSASSKTSSERDRLRLDLNDQKLARAKLQMEVNRLTDEEENLRGQIETLRTSSQSLGAKVTELTASIEQLTGQLKEITDSRDQLQKDLTEAKTFRAALEIQIEDLTKQRNEAVAKAQQAEQKLAALTAAAGPVAAPQTTTKPDDGMVEVAAAPKVEALKPPTVHSFASTRAKVEKGQSATLSWHVSNAFEIHIEPGIGSVSALGSKNVKPRKTTTYTLTATNDGGEAVETCVVEVR